MTKQFKQLLGLLILSLFFGLFRYFRLEEEYPLFNNTKNEQIFTVKSDSIKFVKDYLLNISEPQLVDINFSKTIYDYSLGIFVDARDKEEFDIGHIKGAINIPYEIDDNYNVELLDSIDNEIIMNEKSLVVYCSGDGCTLGKDLAYYLYNEMNFFPLVYFEEGYPEWKKINYPTTLPKYNPTNEEAEYSGLSYSNLDIVLIISLIVTIALFIYKPYKKYLLTFSRILLGLIFIYFSFDKILDPLRFAELTTNYDIIPYNLEYFGALVLPWVEMLIGLFLLTGVFIRISANVALSLMIFFIFMIAQAYLRGKSIDCGCLLTNLSLESASDKRIYMLKRIVQDFYFLALTLLIKYNNKVVDENI